MLTVPVPLNLTLNISTPLAFKVMVFPAGLPGAKVADKAPDTGVGVGSEPPLTLSAYAPPFDGPSVVCAP